MDDLYPLYAHERGKGVAHNAAVDDVTARAAVPPSLREAFGLLLLKQWELEHPASPPPARAVIPHWEQLLDEMGPDERPDLPGKATSLSIRDTGIAAFQFPPDTAPLRADAILTHGTSFASVPLDLPEPPMSTVVPLAAIDLEEWEETVAYAMGAIRIFDMDVEEREQFTLELLKIAATAAVDSGAVREVHRLVADFFERDPEKMRARAQRHLDHGREKRAQRLFNRADRVEAKQSAIAATPRRSG